MNKSHIISTDEDPSLRIESFAVINLRGVSTNKKYYNMATVTQHPISHSQLRNSKPCMHSQATIISFMQILDIYILYLLNRCSRKSWIYELIEMLFKYNLLKILCTDVTNP